MNFKLTCLFRLVFYMQIALFIFTNILGVLPIYFLVVKRNLLQKEVFYFLPSICLSIFSSVYELVFTFLLHYSTGYWFRIYLLLEFFTLFYFFYQLFTSRIVIALLYIFLVSFISYFIFLFFHWKVEDSLKTDSFLSVISTVFVYFFSFFWFRQVFVNFEIDDLFSSPTFIFLCGQLLYFSSTLFLFLMSDYFLKEKKYDFLAFWQLNVFMCMVYRFFLLGALYKGIKK